MVSVAVLAGYGIAELIVALLGALGVSKTIGTAHLDLFGMQSYAYVVYAQLQEHYAAQAATQADATQIAQSSQDQQTAFLLTSIAALQLQYTTNTLSALKNTQYSIQHEHEVDNAARATQIQAEGDRAASEFIALGQALHTTIASEQYQLLHSLGLTQDAIVQNIHEGDQATQQSVVGVHEDILGLDPPIANIGAFLGTSAISMAGAGALVNTLSQSLSQAQHGGIAKCIPSTSSALVQQLMTAALPMLLPLAYKLGGDQLPFVNDLISTAWDMYLEPLQREAPITPEKAPEVAATLFADAMIAGVAAHMASVTAESNVYLKNMGMGYLAGFLADMGSFSRIAGATLGVAISLGVAQPFRYNINQQLRPRLPDARQLTELLSEYYIDSATFEHYMQYEGFSNEWIARLEQLAGAPLRYGQLAAMARTGKVDDDLFDKELRRSSYHEDSIPKIKSLLHDTARQAKITRVNYLLRRLVGSGYIDVAEAKTRFEIAAALPSIEDAMLLAMKY